MLGLASSDRSLHRQKRLVFASLIAPLLATVTWEVVARYAFGAPTTWAYETIYALYIAMFMLGAAVTRCAPGLTSAPIFLWEKWPQRTRAAIDSIAYLACFFQVMVLVLVAGVKATWNSYLMDDSSADTSWLLPLWPLKALVPAAAILLLLQGLSELLKSPHAWKR